MIAAKRKPDYATLPANSSDGKTNVKINLVTPSRRLRAEFLAAVARSRKLHKHYVSPPQTVAAFERNIIKRLKTPRHVGFWILTERRELAGVVNINEIVRGRFRSAYLGYCAFIPHAGRGYMTEGLRAMVPRAFGKLGLHRLEANIQPGNSKSRRPVERLGFRLEGFSPRYLKIAGKWRDHERWAITAEEWVKSSRKKKNFENCRAATQPVGVAAVISDDAR